VLAIRSATQIGELLRESILNTRKLIWAVSYITREGMERFRFELEYLGKKSGSMEILFTTDHGITSADALNELLLISKLGSRCILRNIKHINFHAKLFYFKLNDDTIRIISGSQDLSATLDDIGNHCLVLEGTEEALFQHLQTGKEKNLLACVFPEWEEWTENSVVWSVEKNTRYKAQRTETGKEVERMLDKRRKTEALWKNEIKTSYRKNRDALQGPFPQGYRFLSHVESLHDRDARIHLGTDRNAHVYFEDKFLFYVVINDRRYASPNLVFYPQPNGRLKDGTSSSPELFFPKLSPQREIWNTEAGTSRDEIVVVRPADGENILKRASEILDSLRHGR